MSSQMTRDRILVVRGQAQGLAALLTIVQANRRDTLNIVQADDLDDAWRLLQRSAYHVVLLPCGRRGVRALLAFCERVRAHALRKGIGLAVLKGADATLDESRALASGADLVLSGVDLQPRHLRKAIRTLRNVVHERCPMSVRYGSLKLCADTGLAWDGTRRLHLPPSPFNVLYRLLEARGSVLGPRDLLGPRPDLDEEEVRRNLYTVISRIRKTLGDDHEGLIETVTEMGYLIPPGEGSGGEEDR